MMNRSQIEGRIQGEIRKALGFAQQRATERQAIQRGTTAPYVQELLNAHDAETVEGRRKILGAARALVEQARTATPPKPRYRPPDATESTRVAAEVAEALHLTPDALAGRLDRAREEGDLVLLARLLPVVESRALYAKPLLNHVRVSDAIVDAKATLDAAPEAVAHRAHVEWTDTLDSEINTVANALAGDRPFETVAVYVQTGALPNVLPAL